VGIIACVEVTTTTSTLPTTPTTTTLQPTTTTMNFCVEEQGMNEPLTLQPSQVTYQPSPDQTTPQGDINPKPTPTPGLTFSTTMTPKITVTLDQPTTLTIVYLPVDRPNKPSNVKEFTVQFTFPNGTNTPAFTSVIPSPGASTTTTTPSGVPAQSTTTPSPTGVVPPSPISPQVDLPPNFQVPQNTSIVITITLTTDEHGPHDVCISFLSHCY
jgi:hypothetical protein